MNRRILLVEDDSSLAFVLKDALVHANYILDDFYNGKTALDSFKANYYDIAVLDVMLPVLDGFNLAKLLKAQDRQLPIIFLTARSAEEDKIKGFGLGADDYLTKPFSVEELKARIKAILYRSERKLSASIGHYQFDKASLTLTFGAQSNTLTQREADLLDYFVQHKNQLIKREDILKAVWGDDDYFMGRSLDVFISKIRKYLEADEQVCIKNYHGVGFKLECNKP